MRAVPLRRTCLELALHLGILRLSVTGSAQEREMMETASKYDNQSWCLFFSGEFRVGAWISES